MKDFLEIIKIVIIFSILILINNNLVYGITLDEQIKISNEAKVLCTSLNNYCSVRFFESYVPQGYTSYDHTIHLSTGLTNYLDYNETRAVVLHEVGHVVLNHYKKQDKFLQTWNLNTRELQSFRHSNEYAADEFATKYILLLHQQNYLSQALTKLTAPTKMNLATMTHPSTNDRIKQINSIKINNYKELLK